MPSGRGLRDFRGSGTCVALAHGRKAEGIIRRTPQRPQEEHVLGLTIALLVVALIAGFLGFGGVAGTAAGLAKVVFVVFLILVVLSLLL
jgi:uncharacterized membrane protein YtjA (UPF0391 family)